MLALPNRKMTVDEYLAWAEENPGHYELYGGELFAMAPERVGHGRVKLFVQVALLNGIRASGLPCQVLPDGMTVRVASDAAYEPDALIYCGEELPNSALEIPDPIVVVEVLSPSTRYLDTTAKLSGYFSLPSVHHYLIVDPDRPLVIHHARGQGDAIATRILNGGAVQLDPPGIELTVAEFYPPAA